MIPENHSPPAVSFKDMGDNDYTVVLSHIASISLSTVYSSTLYINISGKDMTIKFYNNKRRDEVYEIIKKRLNSENI
jgi:hypothetical protein